MLKSLFQQKGFLFFTIIGMSVLLLSFGFGYFFGRYEQIQINKSLLKPIPDVNCGAVNSSKK